MTSANTVPPEGRLFIHATNVHRGGGRSLLCSVVQSLSDPERTVLLVDSRMQLPVVSSRLKIRRVSPTILQRALAEVWLATNVSAADRVLCFGNLPPLLRLRGRTQVLVQNRYLVGDAKLTGFPLLARLRIAAERLWLAGRAANVDAFIVQTPTMQSLLQRTLSRRVPISVLPFVANHDGYVRQVTSFRAKVVEFDFVYVASGEPHKNHRTLMEAWYLLAGEGCYPSLCLTLEPSRFDDLNRELVAQGCCRETRISNAGELSAKEVALLYEKTGALIYPSAFESLGLPLIEARQVGLPILAPELDYVRDVLDPEQTFDPASAVSIARAVKRFLGIEEHPLNLRSAARFLEEIGI